MSLELSELERVIRLAHLDVDDARKEKYLVQIQRTLSYMEQLNQLDLSNVVPTSHGQVTETVLREDEVRSQGDLMLDHNAPDWDSGAFGVPRILAE
jgi:aspartyl-tRNA(Asn)/glutamyl-tRNA(Gln) amidotransferase subunit C